jgi:bifunctional pyridoxal-dependent enzyme with beta-cystathionase and maltose regulon repressor activities
VADRRRIKRPTVVYLLWVDYSVLDVYAEPGLAFAAAERFMKETGGYWLSGRPGRWFGQGGRLVEVEPREMLTTGISMRGVA